MKKREIDKRGKKQIKNKQLIGKILIVISIIFLVIILTLIIIEIKNIKEEKTKEEKSLIIYEENKNNKEELRKYSIEALLLIPKLEVKEVIYSHENNIYEDLEKGIVLYNQYDELNGKLNNISLILGHNSGLRTKKVFLKLEKLEIGDEFIIEKDGNRYIYKIEDRHIVSPKKMGPFEREIDKNKVYLFTCYPYPINNKRLILEGVKTSQYTDNNK